MTRVLYVIACAAPPAQDVGQLVRLAQAGGWDVCVLATPSGRKFTDVAALEQLTGHPVRSEYKNPGEPDVLPPPDARGMPVTNPERAAHPAFAENIARLRSWGVTVLTRTQLDEGPGQPGFPWARALAAVSAS